MKPRLALLSAFLALPVLAACPAPESPTNPDASDASTTDLSAQACRNMDRQGCPQADDCAPTFRTALDTHAVTVPFLTCLAHVSGDPHTCGPQVRCGQSGK